jgi:hypothetical protein
MYKQNAIVNKKNELDLTAINGVNCDGLFDKRKYIGFIGIKKLKEILNI